MKRRMQRDRYWAAAIGSVWRKSGAPTTRRPSSFIQDLNAGDKDKEARMTALAQAYKLLIQVAENQLAEQPAPGLQKHAVALTEQLLSVRYSLPFKSREIERCFCRGDAKMTTDVAQAPTLVTEEQPGTGFYAYAVTRLRDGQEGGVLPAEGILPDVKGGVVHLQRRPGDL